MRGEQEARPVSDHGAMDDGERSRSASPPTPAPEVLFVCVHNAGRSQMAAALLARHAGEQVTVRSGGTAPADTINPVVVQAMREIGIDLASSGARPKRLDDADVRASDVVVTMGCGDTCPYYPGKRYEDWPVGDPAGQDLGAVRAIRDDIDQRVRQLVGEILPEPDRMVVDP